MITFYAVSSGSVQKHLSAHHIGLYKNAGVRNRPVHMGLGGEVHHNIKLLLLKQIHDKGTVRDISFHKVIIWPVCHGRKRFQIARIGQKVQIHNLILRILIHHMVNKIAADKTGASGNQDFHNQFLFSDS